MPDWSPAAYLKFEDERTRPARDLLAQVPLQQVRQAVDVGCGPGNSTELLVARYKEAAILGIDSSPAMLDQARKRVPRARFEPADANNWVPQPEVDLVFANASYQWVAGHLAHLPLVLGALRPGAVLAVQMPDNLGEPTHQIMRDVAAAGPWASRLAHAARAPLPSVRRYYEALQPVAARLEIWHSIYNHVLADAAAIVAWLSSTGLRPFLEPLTEGERRDFLDAYLEKITTAYPATADGKVLLRFPRLFIVAQR